MRIMVPQLRVLSNVGFPALYQGLFSYLLLLGHASGSWSVLIASVIIGSAFVGIPLTMAYNLSSLSRQCPNTLLLIGRPVLVAMVLPFCQLVLLAVLPRMVVWLA
jgi:hypothetical protein